METQFPFCIDEDSYAGPDRFLLFNGRHACPRGARLLEPDGTCSSKTCCPRTRLQVARWDHRERGRCWVLRRRRRPREEEAEDYDGGSASTVRVSVGAAYGIIGLTTLFVLSFRLVTRKLDECRRKTGRLPR